MPIYLTKIDTTKNNQSVCNQKTACLHNDEPGLGPTFIIIHSLFYIIIIHYFILSNFILSKYIWLGWLIS